MADNISNRGSFADNVVNGNASIAPLPANRMESKYEVTVGGEHMTITNNIAGGLSVGFSHDTRELRPPGWQREAMMAFLGNPQVMNLLELQGIKPSDVLKQSEKQFGRIPDRWDPMRDPDSSVFTARLPENVGRPNTPYDTGLSDSLMKDHDHSRVPGGPALDQTSHDAALSDSLAKQHDRPRFPSRSPHHRAPSLKPPGF